ncbi:MAG: trypsin-like peptidase domain-containing protein [Propionibacteriaceae bacterium]
MSDSDDSSGRYIPIYSAQPPPEPKHSGHGPDFCGPEDAPTQVFPAPAGVQPIQPRTVYSASQFAGYPTAVPSAPRRGMRGPAVIAVAALTALLVGGAAGVGGYLVADTSNRPTTFSPAPTSTPAESSTAPSQASTMAPPPKDADTVAIAAKVLPSTVTIEARNGSKGSTGSGFVIDAAKGLIMTNNHVVAMGDAGGNLQVILNDHKKSQAEIVGRSPSYDIAVIRIEPSTRLVAAEIGDSAATKVGQTVIAFGSPLGLGGTVTQGIVSALDRPVAVGGQREDPNSASAYSSAIQTDAPINPGNSGGPLVDAGGRVVGVDSAILTLGSTGGGQSGNIGLGFAIPINQAMEVGRELIQKGYATYPVIGATVRDAQALDGVVLSVVTGGGPASAAGLQTGDLVTHLDGRPVSKAVELIVKIRAHRPGQKVDITYDRGGKTGQATVTLGTKKG